MNKFTTKPMNDKSLFDIQECEGEIYDLPEMQDDCDEQSFKSKLDSNKDF